MLATRGDKSQCVARIQKYKHVVVFFTEGVHIVALSTLQTIQWFRSGHITGKQFSDTAIALDNVVIVFNPLTP